MTDAETSRAIWMFSGIFVALGLVVAANFCFDQFFRGSSRASEDIQRPD